jgi:hypothetical protein
MVSYQLCNYLSFKSDTVTNTKWVLSIKHKSLLTIDNIVQDNNFKRDF